MSRPDAIPRAPAVVRHNRAAIDEIVHCVEEGTYCAVLGPRLSGKTVLLQYVAQTLAERRGLTCLYLDLYDVRSSTLQGFFADLSRLTADGLRVQTGLEVTVPKASTASSAVFRGFLDETVSQIGQDLVLIIEHLEALPTDLIQALLTSLRAAYMDQQTQECRVTVVISGALSLATLTVGESSPFRGIARRVFIGDPAQALSEALIAERLAAEGLSVTNRARKRLLQATGGDPFLIRRLCRQATEVARTAQSARLRGRHVKQVVAEFLRDEVYHYAPLQEAVWLIEEDPDLLRCILLLLAHGTVRKSDLPLPLSPDLDPLYLTGVVEQVGTDSYRLQNEIYRRFLGQHFHPGHVGHLLTMTGRWDSAIDYLEAAIHQGNERARLDLLSATINSMYASEDVGQAARFLLHGLSSAFGVVDARIWVVPYHEENLRLVGQLGPRSDTALWSRLEIPVTADRLEARVYRQARALRGPEGERYVWRAMPLLSPGVKPIGVVTVCDDLLGSQVVEHRERDLQLVGYLNQAGRAIHAVDRRRQELALAGRMQASLLPGAPPRVRGWQLAALLQPARETSGDFYDFIPLPGGRIGLVIADVADKGMGAALYMALSRTLIRTYAADYPERPDLALQAANERILTDTQADLFVTVFYGILDPESGSLTYCNAGHHPPFLLKAMGRADVEILPGRGMAMGVVQDTRWGHTTIQLDPGAGLLLYTDGVVDALSPEQQAFGSEGLLQVVQTNLGAGTSQGLSAEDVQGELFSRLQQFMAEQPQFDDITLMAVVRKP